ncbi:polysaccharide deacetylase family protein [Salinigranum halophilum]|uniref:polysaccharide deacetylase family protein n=1 Tax=Salinigranum halophilum TaxID=2565931 RepID=UPI0010A847A1|nr:polysaccharide deacetylase family protein [Salinigranum halophilum]
MSEMNAVMYHYVRPTPNRPPHGYYHLSLDDFKRQLSYFEEEYGFVDRDSFIKFLRGNRDTPDGIVLTFDDALFDHHEWVLPELQRRNLWGLFFVPTGPFVNDRVLPVHRIHALVGSIPANELHYELESVLDTEPSMSGESRGVADAYDEQSSSATVSDFKRLLNFVVAPEDVQGVLDRLEGRLTDYEPPTVSEYYLSETQLLEMVDAGMLLGAHSVTHPVLARLDEKRQRSEIELSVTWLDNLVGSQPVTTFAYPYGGEDTFTDTTVGALADAGCEYAFTTESGTLAGRHREAETFSLPRRDCNEFNYGSATFELP